MGGGAVPLHPPDEPQALGRGRARPDPLVVARRVPRRGSGDPAVARAALLPRPTRSAAEHGRTRVVRAALAALPSRTCVVWGGIGTRNDAGSCHGVASSVSSVRSAG